MTKQTTLRVCWIEGVRVYPLLGSSRESFIYFCKPMGDKKVPGFTKKQKDWCHERDGHQCSFFTLRNGIWQRCHKKSNLEVHHVLPRGWWDEHSTRTWDVNSKQNCLLLCDGHHRGYNATFSDTYVIHPDCRTALSEYRKGNKEAFDGMIDWRKELCQRGIPYWNTQFDWLFHRILRERNASFDTPFPQREDPWYLEGKDESSV